ncbi:FAD-dependent oxidoreductase [Desulfonatronospira sp.]|uniref:FAD-dependent oxidoreductase n=1 Tax=Desulfonatronospira sp. TaxID=1962951 RepID=UPI0025B872BE|nr:FAD-dependent oxidoreductase [Desulfonatronospira sp.]
MKINAMPPCQAKCPIHMDVQGYVAAIAGGDVQEADRVIRRTNPFPSVCGRICTRECESVCRRGKSVDEPVAIRALKRYASDSAAAGAEVPGPEIRFSEKVCIVGAGPAGLTAAHDLALMGYRVTVYESEDEPGGMLTRGIPRYRLPLDLVRSEVDRIRSLGVEIKTGYMLGRDISLQDLQKDFDAVFLGMGSEKSTCPECSGMELSGVWTAVEFLKDVSRGKKFNPGNKVIVIGGGHTAIDAARTCLRLGAEDVTIAYRRTIDEMPAGMDEVEDAREEGIRFEFLTAPEAFEGSGKVEKMRCVRMDLDKSCGGKGKLTCVEDSAFEMEADTIILATGYVPRTEAVQELCTEGGDRLEIKDAAGATRTPGVFAGGDFVSGPTTVVQAIASGRKAAEAVHRYLRGMDQSPEAQEEILQDLDDDVARLVPKAGREKPVCLDSGSRVHSFDEVEHVFTPEQARTEAARCLHCSLGAHVSRDCAVCLNCVLVCPYNVPRPGEEKAYIDMSQCQACGVCAGQCPASAIDLRLEPRTELRQNIRRVLERAESNSQNDFIFGYVCDFSRTRPRELKGENVYTITRPGLGRIDVYELLVPFEAGAREVLVSGCGEEDCKFKDCSLWTRRNVQKAARILESIGIDPERLKIVEG